MQTARLLRIFMAHLQAERGLSAHTCQAYQKDLGAYLDYLQRLGKLELDVVQTSEISAYMQYLAAEKRLAPASRSRALSAIKALHKFALKEGLIKNDSAAEVEAPKLAQRLPKALNLEQVTKLLESAGGGDPISVRDRAFLELSYATGARVSEIVSLHVDDFEQTDDLTFLKLHGKGSKERIVPVGSFARQALDAYLVRARPALAAKGDGSTRLFLNKRGKALSRQSAWGIIQEAARKADLSESVSPHTLRHSFATHMIEGGADVRVVGELLGHASVTTTQIYTKLAANTVREIYLESHPRAL